MTETKQSDPRARRHRQDRHTRRQPVDRAWPSGPHRRPPRWRYCAFDWDDPATHRDAVEGADRVYLVAPVMRTRFAPQVSAFLDLAEAVGVRHVTYLSAYGIEFAPAEVALRAVELDLMGRSTLTHSIVRPAWFMQNFSETFLMPVDDAIVVPTGTGGEAFVDAEDIAAVAAATLADPAAHVGAEYAPTGPDVLTVSAGRRHHRPA